MSEEVSKAIMKQKKLSIKYLNMCDIKTRVMYTRQRHYCSSLNRTQLKKSYRNFDIKNLIDFKKFWKTNKPICLDKRKLSSPIMFLEKKTAVTTNSEIEKTLNIYFRNFVKSLKILDCENINQFYERM